MPVQSDFATFQAQIKKTAAEDATGRLVVALLKEPCTDEILDRWHRAITHKELSGEDGKRGSVSQYEGEALAEIAKWVATAAESQIFACYGKATFNSLYGKSDLVKRVENDVLYTVFPAAPEKIVTANTAFKTGSSSAVYYGLTKDFFEDKKNQQLANIAISLKTIGAWDLNDLNALSDLQGNNVTTVTELAKFIKSEFEQGAKISLDALWARLQLPPFGYYNSLTSAVFLGLALRSFIGGSFNWLDHQNNTNQPTDKNLASMINKMMNGQTLNNYLSSGSAIWQKFKPYAKAVFGLKDTECVSDSETRKYILVRATSFGVPFWSLKYVPADKLGGGDAKATIEKLIDAFVDFAYNISDDQEGVMDTVLTLFNGRGGLKKVMSDTLSDKGVMYMAFKRFVFAQRAELETLYSSLVLTDKDLFDNIRNYLQAAINTWREDSVKAKLPELANELNVVQALNAALCVSEKSYKDLQRVLNNVLENMRIPGTVIETLSYTWIPAMKMMRRISKTVWADLSSTSDVVDTLQSGAKTAWEMLSQPKIILEAVLDKEKVTCSEDELNGIYNDLRPSVYETGEQTFYTALHKLLDKVSYRRNIAEVNMLWLEKSKVKTVRDWCNDNNCPISWLFDGSDAIDISNIAAIQNGGNIDGNALQNALSFLQRSNLSVLYDPKVILNRFFANIGETYRSAFETDGQTLYNRLKTNAKVSPDVYLWATRVPAIKAVLNEFLKGRHKEEAKSRVSKMPEAELRSDVLNLLEDNPELYSYFLKY